MLRCIGHLSCLGLFEDRQVSRCRYLSLNEVGLVCDISSEPSAQMIVLLLTDQGTKRDIVD